MAISYSDMGSGIYKITTNNNAEIYIGSTVCFSKRWGGHIADLRRGRHHSKYLQRVYNKYGESNLSIVVLEYVESYEDRLLREQYYIDTLCPKYNGAPVAGNLLGFKHSEETKERMSKAQTGRKATPKTIQKLKLVQAEVHQRPGYIENLRLKNQGSNNPTSKLTELEVVEIKHLLIKGYSQTYISSLFNVGEDNIGSIQRGETWGHLEVEGFNPFKKIEKISSGKVVKIKELLMEGLTIDHIAEVLQVGKTSVGNIKTGKRHSSVYVEGFDPALTRKRNNIKN